MKKNKLTLYIMDYTPLAVKAIENFKAICQAPEIAEIYDPEIINLREQPHLAEEENIIATPVLIKKLPEPLRRFIGDLSNQEKIIAGLSSYESKK